MLPYLRVFNGFHGALILILYPNFFSRGGIGDIAHLILGDFAHFMGEHIALLSILATCFRLCGFCLFFTALLVNPEVPFLLLPIQMLDKVLDGGNGVCTAPMTPNTLLLGECILIARSHSSRGAPIASKEDSWALIVGNRGLWYGC